MKRILTPAILAILPSMLFAQDTLRIATFNASLNRRDEGALAADIASADNAQAMKVAQIIAEVNPDLLLINEFDFAPGQAEAFAAAYLGGAYPYAFAAPSNTGTPSGLDLDGNGEVVLAPGSPQYANDSHGFGFFPGQYGMAVFSKYPINADDVRTFQTFLWSDMPEARKPMNPDGSPYYSDEAWSALRLSSKSHWDVPVQVGDAELHFLVSHPTPPVFDGPEDRNGARNADEIRFWADYVQGAEYMTDDMGHGGGLADGALFVIAGDMNSDPLDGDSVPGAMQQLLALPQVDDSVSPASEGAVAAAQVGGANADHKTPADQDTADWNDDAPGNLRVDYVLPSAALSPVDGGVYWPAPDQPGADLIDASDHRMVWIDIVKP